MSNIREITVRYSGKEKRVSVALTFENSWKSLSFSEEILEKDIEVDGRTLFEQIVDTVADKVVKAEKENRDRQSA